jgi:hypothetical protein
LEAFFSALGGRRADLAGPPELRAEASLGAGEPGASDLRAESPAVGGLRGAEASLVLRAELGAGDAERAVEPWRPCGPGEAAREAGPEAVREAGPGEGLRGDDPRFFPGAVPGLGAATTGVWAAACLTAGPEPAVMAAVKPSLEAAHRASPVR